MNTVYPTAACPPQTIPTLADTGEGCQLLRPAPEPGELLAAVHREWDTIETLGGRIPPDLPRPWEPATCTPPDLAADLLRWLADYVDWLNTQHAWDPDDHIPSCWPRHPHLIHDLAVLVDQHRRSYHDPTSTTLDTWLRIQLPAFHDRRHRTTRQHCVAGHRVLVAGDPPNSSHAPAT